MLTTTAGIDILLNSAAAVQGIKPNALHRQQQRLCVKNL